MSQSLLWRGCAVLALLLAAPATAAAQDEMGMSADDLSEPPAPEPGFWEGGGVKISDDMVFHPSFDLSTGYQTNIFSADDGDPRPAFFAPGDTGAVGAPVLLVGVNGGIATRPKIRREAEPASGPSARPSLAFKGDLNLTWRQYISDYPVVSDQSDLQIGLLADARFNPEGELTFILRDGFTRAVRPPAQEAFGSVDRDKNELTLGAIFKPGGGAIQGYANYVFTIDFFEPSNLSFANRMQHMFNLGGKWQWLPKTQFQADIFVGYTSADDATYKPAGTPFKFMAGTSTLITPTFGTVLKGGWGYGAYDTGPAFNSYLALVEGRWALGPFTRLAFGYLHDFADSLVGNYYVDHAFYGRLAMQFVGRWQLRAKGELRFRNYDGIINFMGDPPTQFCQGGAAGCGSTDRTDIVGRVEASIEYQVNAWLYAGASYTFQNVTTDSFIQSGGNLDSNGYVWNEFLARVSAKF